VAEVGVAAITVTVAVVISATAGADTSARIIDRRQVGVIATLDPNRKINQVCRQPMHLIFIFGMCREALRRQHMGPSERRWFCNG
jgi:hypothetical protein